MQPSELRKLFDLEDTYWWYVARRELVRALLLRYRRLLPGRVRILDVGCGGGAALVTLADLGRVIGLDRSPEALALSRSRGDFPLIHGSAERLPLRDESVEVVTALDVLEHVADDAAALREMARVCKPGGLVILTVPAYQSLWSEHDEALDHYRRYRAGQVARLVQGAGLRMVRRSYCITLLLAPIFLFRLAQRLLAGPNRGRPRTAIRPLPRSANRALIGLLRLETAWLLRVALPAGVSVVCAARRPIRPPGR